MPNQSVPDTAVFVREGDAFLPTSHAVGPWADDRLHGGPVLGLLARAMEGALGDVAWVPTRLTFDLYRVVPKAALHVESSLLRQSNRLRIAVASVRAGATEVARATALSLIRGAPAKHSLRFAVDPSVPGPDGLESSALLRGRQVARMPRGFHTSVETRWVPQRTGEPLAIWFRMPMPLVEGEVTTGLQRAAALSDYCNALASLSAREAGAGSPPYINTDTTLYLSRAPAGEWIGLCEERVQEQDGISLTQTALLDAQGCFGRASQARLANG